MGKSVNKTFDEIMQDLPDKPLMEFPDEFEPDTSDIPEISSEEFELIQRYTKSNRALCRVIRALLEHNNLSIEEAKSRMGSLSKGTINLIMEKEQVPVKNSLLLISISLLMMDRKIKIPGVVEKTLKAWSKSAA